MLKEGRYWRKALGRQRERRESARQEQPTRNRTTRPSPERKAWCCFGRMPEQASLRDTNVTTLCRADTQLLHVLLHTRVIC